MNNKQIILAILQDKLDLYKDIKHKKFAILSAIRQITSMDDVESVEESDLKKIKYIGKSISGWIVESFDSYKDRIMTKKELIAELRVNRALLGGHSDEQLGELGYQRRSDWDSLIELLVDDLEDTGHRASIAGSARRGSLIIHDFDVIATLSYPELIDVMSKINEERKSEYSIELIGKGKKRVRVLLTDTDNNKSIEGDIRLIPDQSYYSALIYFTGPAGFNVNLRGLAKKRGYKLNEYCLQNGDEQIILKDEAHLFKILGLKYVKPTDRK